MLQEASQIIESQLPIMDLYFDQARNIARGTRPGQEVWGRIEDTDSYQNIAAVFSEAMEEWDDASGFAKAVVLATAVGIVAELSPLNERLYSEVGTNVFLEHGAWPASAAVMGTSILWEGGLAGLTLLSLSNFTETITEIQERYFGIDITKELPEDEEEKRSHLTSLLSFAYTGLTFGASASVAEQKMKDKEGKQWVAAAKAGAIGVTAIGAMNGTLTAALTGATNIFVELGIESAPQRMSDIVTDTRLYVAIGAGRIAWKKFKKHRSSKE